MREFQERNKAKKRLYSKTVLVVLFLLLILVARGAVSVFYKERESHIEMDRAQVQKNELTQRYTFIKDRADQLQNEAGIEAEIRSKFDVIKEGEGVIVIVDRELPVVEEDKRGVLKKFWDSVVGVFKKNGTSTDEEKIAN